jgi:succinoglycan biosynthesis transport protein ExoP
VEQEQEQTRILDFREILWKARRYKWLALFPIVLLLCAACVYLMITPQVYESAVVVSVDDKTPVSQDLGSILNRDRRDENRAERVQKVDSKIHSRAFLEAIVTKTGLAKNPKLLAQASEASREMRGVSREEVATRMAVLLIGKDIVVTASGDVLVRIAAKGSTPRGAQALAQMIADELIARNKASSIERATERGEFSADQISVYEERLAKSEAALRSHEQSVIGRKLTSNPINETNYDTAKGVVGDARVEMDQIRARLQTDLSIWQGAGGGGAGPPALRNSRTAELEGRLNELETSYGMAMLGTGRDVESVKMKIGGVRQSLYSEYQDLASNLPDLSSSAREAAAGIALDRAELRSLKQKETRMSALTSDYSRRVVSKPTEELESERLRTDVQGNRDLLLALKKEATSSRISAALETSQLGMEVQILESPQIPLRPAFPDPLRILGIALFIGPLLGVGAAIMAERFGAALTTMEQAEREIGARVIGTIPKIEGWAQPGNYFQRYWPVMSIALVLFATAVFYTLHATVLKPDTTESVEAKR